MDDDDGKDDKHYLKQSNLAHSQFQELDEKEEEKVLEERVWKLKDASDEQMITSDEEKLRESERSEEKIGDSEMESKTNFAKPFDSIETFYNNYRNYFSGRPEVLFLIRSMDETATENYDKTFIDLIELHPDTEMGHILRISSSSCPNSTNSDHPVRNKHAVVVSNFREPDRRLGRYSKYYYHHNVGPEVYSRKVFVGGLPACLKEGDILSFFSRYGRLQVDWPSKNYGSKSESDPSIYNETITSNASQPTSHLGMTSPPFGQINPFVSDNYTLPTEQMGSFNHHGIGSGNGFLNSEMMSPPSRNTGFGGGSSSGEGSIGEKRPQHLGYVFLLFEKERSVRDLVSECFEEEEGLFITLESSIESIRVQIRPWLLADAEFLMDFNVPINTKLVAFIGGVPRPLKAVELAHFFEQTYGNVVCVGIDIDNKFKYPRGSGRVAFSNYDAYVQAITDRYIVLDHEDIHKRVEIKPYFFHNQSCEECSGRYHRQYAPFFCPSLECFQYYCEPCWHKMHAHPSRFHHMPVVKGV
uniref:RRM domain-containing protein n=1 Tax=Caenorhabditis tropicalis TaxID=1561998 RepID=A0A1I7UAA2_9PELO